MNKKGTRLCALSTCKKRFICKSNHHRFCSAECVMAKGDENSEKVKKELKKKVWTKEKAELKEKLLTHKDYLKLLQTVFNTYIRLRDKGLPCISCGTTAKIQYHAGHYFSAGGHPNLRFAESNVHKQCVQCNNYLHGNLINYRPALELKIGHEEYEALCNNRDVPRKYSIPEIKDLIAYYKQKIKELK